MRELLALIIKTQREISHKEKELDKLVDEVKIEFCTESYDEADYEADYEDDYESFNCTDFIFEKTIP